MENIDKLVETLSQKFGGIQPAMDKINERMADVDTKVTKVTDEIDEIRTRLARREKLSDESGIRISATDGKSLVHTVSRECGEYLVNLIRNPRLVRDLSSGVGSQGGVLVTPEYATELLKLVQSFGFFRRHARTVPMSAKQQVFPRLDGEGTDALWVTEGGSPATNTEPAFGSVTLTNEILMSLTPIPVTLLQDSNPDIGQIVAEHIARKFAKAEDLAGWKGTGAGIATQQPFTGILNHASVNELPMASGLTGFDDVEADALLDMQDAVIDEALDGAAYFMHRSVFNKVKKLKDTAGAYIYQAPAAGEPSQLWDFPVYKIPSLPAIGDSAADTPFIIFGNPKWAMLGDRRQLEIATSEHALFSNLKVLTRGFERIAIEVAIPEGFCVLRTAAV